MTLSREREARKTALQQQIQQIEKQPYSPERDRILTLLRRSLATLEQYP